MKAKGYFSVDVYHCRVHVIIAKDICRSINYRLKKNEQEIIEFCPCAYFCGSLGDMANYYLFFQEGNINNDFLNHEKSHLVEQILIDRDIKPVDEQRSYLDGYVSTRLHKLLKIKKIKVKI